MLTVAYTLCNRGRSIESFVAACLQFLDTHKSVILLIDESDATDKELGLNGREVFEIIAERTNRTDLVYMLSPDHDVGINYIASNNLKVQSNIWKLINAKALKHPQGKSEHYQHQSAFVRPLSRFFQAKEAISTLNELQKDNPDKLVLLLRDQNSFLPGEGRLENLLRKINNITCITDSLHRTYQLQYLEGDTGGLNYLAYRIYRMKIWKVISKFITIADKIESICVSGGILKQKNLATQVHYQNVEGMDHGLMYVDFHVDTK